MPVERRQPKDIQGRAARLGPFFVTSRQCARLRILVILSYFSYPIWYIMTKVAKASFRG
jgi:hypothetical protein